MSVGRICDLPNGRYKPKPLSRTGLVCSKCKGDVEAHDIHGSFPRRVYRCRRCGSTKLIETEQDQVTIEMGE